MKPPISHNVCLKVIHKGKCGRNICLLINHILFFTFFPVKGVFLDGGTSITWNQQSTITITGADIVYGT